MPIKRDSIDNLFVSIYYIYQIQDMNTKVAFDSHELTIITSVNQTTVINADTESPGNASQPLQSTVNQNDRQERNMFCHRSVSILEPLRLICSDSDPFDF